MGATAASSDQSDRPPICPRCGYDLRGEVATWRDSCPMEGRCAECGLEMWWGDVFRHSEHAWLFEYHARRCFFSSMWRTVTRLHYPPGFWRDVRLTDHVRITPILVLVLIPMLLLAVMRFTLYIGVFANAHNLIDFGSFPFSASWIEDERQWWIGWRQGAGNWVDVLRSSIAHLPPSVRSVGVGVVPFLTATILVPLAFRLLPVTIRKAKVKWTHLQRAALYSVVPILWIAALWAVVSLALNGLSIDFSALTFFVRARDQNDVFLSILEWPRDVLIFWILMSFWFFWWGAACRHYLKLPTPWWVAAAIVVIVLMINVIIAEYVLDTDLLMDTFFSWYSSYR